MPGPDVLVRRRAGAGASCVRAGVRAGVSFWGRVAGRRGERAVEALVLINAMGDPRVHTLER